MEVNEHGITSLYRLNGLAWEKIAERPYDPALEDYENRFLGRVDVNFDAVSP